jgi:glycosyltransferase involved in cell wall biosynthesis
MKIGLISSAVPLIFGGGRFIVDWAERKLTEHGHEVEIVYLPSTDDADSLLSQMNAFRLLHLDEYFDRVITFRPPSHVVWHRRKVVWFIHHIRVLYDLWASPYRPVPDNAHYRALREAVCRFDTHALREAHRVFSSSRVVADRLLLYNGVKADVLYPPVLQPDLFRCGDYGNEIVMICRMEHHKRQHLLVEAMRHVQSPVRLRLCGTGSAPAYIQSLHEAAARIGGGRVVIEDRWISEEEKADRLSGALAAAYVPLDEDSYGYPTIEAAHARRCTVTTSDSGGVLEFVTDDETGLVAPPEPQALAEIFDRLHADRALARRIGEAAHAHVRRLGIDWDRVVEALTA